MSVKQIGLSPDGFPMFHIGNLYRNVEEGDGVHTTKTISVVVNLSRINSLEKVGGVHFALSVEPPMPWAKAAELKIFGEELALTWKMVEPEALALLLPNLTADELAEIACATSSNSEFTAQRKDVHAHVQATTKAVWASKKIRRMVDDARAPNIVAEEAIEAAQTAARKLIEGTDS
jgi:hypothetical protein